MLGVSLVEEGPGDVDMAEVVEPMAGLQGHLWQPLPRHRELSGDLEKALAALRGFDLAALARGFLGSDPLVRSVSIASSAREALDLLDLALPVGSLERVANSATVLRIFQQTVSLAPTLLALLNHNLLPTVQSLGLRALAVIIPGPEVPVESPDAFDQPAREVAEAAPRVIAYLAESPFAFLKSQGIAMLAALAGTRPERARLLVAAGAVSSVCGSALEGIFAQGPSEEAVDTVSSVALLFAELARQRALDEAARRQVLAVVPDLLMLVGVALVGPSALAIAQDLLFALGVAAPGARPAPPAAAIATLAGAVLRFTAPDLPAPVSAQAFRTAAALSLDYRAGWAAATLPGLLAALRLELQAPQQQQQQQQRGEGRRVVREAGIAALGAMSATPLAPEVARVSGDLLLGLASAGGELRVPALEALEQLFRNPEVAWSMASKAVPAVTRTLCAGLEDGDAAAVPDKLVILHFHDASLSLSLLHAVLDAGELVTRAAGLAGNPALPLFGPALVRELHALVARLASRAEKVDPARLRPDADRPPIDTSTTMLLFKLLQALSRYAEASSDATVTEMGRAVEFVLGQQLGQAAVAQRLQEQRERRVVRIKFTHDALHTRFLEAALPVGLADLLGKAARLFGLPAVSHFADPVGNAVRTQAALDGLIQAHLSSGAAYLTLHPISAPPAVSTAAAAAAPVAPLVTGVHMTMTGSLARRRATLMQRLYTDLGSVEGVVEALFRGWREALKAGGSLGFTTFQSGLVNAGITDPITIRSLFVAFDKDGDGAVDYSEIALGLADQIGNISDEARLKLFFLALDVDGNNSISLSEVILAVTRFGARPISREALLEIERVFHQVDTDKDGSWSWEEFVKAVLVDRTLQGLIPG